jgi:hypothetical protein
MRTIAQSGAAVLPVALNLIGFNLAWLATVLGAADGLAWAGPAAMAIFAAFQVPASPRPRYDLTAMAVFAAAGVVVDSAWSASGAVAYAAAWPSQLLAPVWLVALWASFSLTLGHSLAWIRRKPVAASLLGGLGGGFSYWAGVRLGAVELNIPEPVYALGVGLSWAIIFPALIGATARLARRRLPAYQR